MSLTNLKKELEKQKNKAGLVGTRLNVNEVPGNSFSASITFDFKTISLDYGVDLDLVPDQETRRFVEEKSIESPELKIGEDILDHEMGHREKPVRTTYGCPYTAEMHDSILDSITRGLAEKEKQGLEGSVCNAFEDLLDNINCRKDTDFAGQTLFWNNQGLVNSENGKFSPSYEAFVKINLLFGGKDYVVDATLLKRFYQNDEKVQTAVRNFVDYFNSKLNIQSSLGIHEKPEFNELFNKDMEQREELWSDLAYNYAIMMAELLDQKQTEQRFGSKDNPFDKQIKQPKTKQEIAYKRYKTGKGPAAHRDLQEQLYDLYKKISREIPVETSHFTKSSGIPLVHYGRRSVTEDETKLRFRGIGFDENGELSIKTSRHSLKYPVSYKVHPRNFPDLKVALMDRSGSMAWNRYDDENEVGDTSFIPWGDESKYHFALKGYFGIDNYLDSQGIGPYMENVALGFSGEHIVRGNSKEVAMSLLTTPSGGTNLNIDELIEEMTPNSFTLSISDGSFSFGEEQKEKLNEKIKQGVDYAHIQIGSDTPYSLYLKELDIDVLNVNGDDDLSNGMVKIVSKKYRSLPIK